LIGDYSLAELILASMPGLIEFAVPLILGLVALYLYKKAGKSGLELISIAFLVGTVPGLIRLATFGNAYFLAWLLSLGYEVQRISLISRLLFLVRAAFHVTFLILAILGLIKLSDNSHLEPLRTKSIRDASIQ
jgi:hypothetical protein